MLFKTFFSAARGCAPRPVLELLIKAFPQALDVRDAFNKTPRDFYQKSTENMAILDRPICCWVHHFHDVEERDAVEDEINELLMEVSRLESGLAEEREFKNVLADKLVLFEQKVSDYANVVHGRNVEQKAKELEDYFCSELRDLEVKLDEIARTLKHKYDTPDYERSYIRAFDEDIACIYKEVNLSTMALNHEVVALQKLVDVSIPE